MSKFLPHTLVEGTYNVGMQVGESIQWEVADLVEGYDSKTDGIKWHWKFNYNIDEDCEEFTDDDLLDFEVASQYSPEKMYELGYRHYALYVPPTVYDSVA